MSNLKSNWFYLLGSYVKLNTRKLRWIICIHSLELGTELVALKLHKRTPGM